MAAVAVCWRQFDLPGNGTNTSLADSNVLNPYANRPVVFSQHSIQFENDPYTNIFRTTSVGAICNLKKKKSILLYTRRNEWGEPSARLSAWVRHLRRNVATVASR